MMRIWKKKYFFLLAVSLALAACQPREVSITPVTSGQMADAGTAQGNFYDLGKSYLKSSNVGLAIDAFRQDMLRNGDNMQSLNGLGISYDMLGRYDLSQKYYERSLDLDPASTVTLSNLAYSQYMQGEYDTAVLLANKAEELLTTRQEKNEDATKTALGNLEAAGEKKMEEEKLDVGKVSVDYRVQRVDERNWEIMQENQRRPVKKTVRYKSAIEIGVILDRAKAGKKNEIKKHPRQQSAAACRIVNGTGRAGMAKRMASFFVSQGLSACELANARSYDRDVSVIKFSPGHGEEARKLAQALPVSVKIVVEKNLKTKIELTLGADLLPFDASLSSHRGTS